MPPKRKRDASLPPKGLLQGEQLWLPCIPGASTSTPWGWVGTEVTDAARITLEHRLATCNLSRRNRFPICANKYSYGLEANRNLTPSKPATVGEFEEDIIVISDDDETPSLCSKKTCRANPNCLNHVGQEAWEDGGDAGERFMDLAKLGNDPSELSREPDVPVGLKNLGATCYANASLQVWYRDLAFRSGVYSCEPPESIEEKKYKESPIFQLQVTFAALQEGSRSVFNPQKLVESLQLRTSEQQDAQEFSKLFMSHLDAEFKKQSLHSLKSLITDQFQGTQAYGTICHACKHRSERDSDFLEIEVSFGSNSKLEDCLSASLLPEKLTGDNRYYCPRCENLEDATRYTELRQLPPVLHFSLLRFVYDVSTMERKKSKHSISFPRVLDMNRFLGSKFDRENGTAGGQEPNLYDLRGILLHKGASAYHGHYEAQVDDTEAGSWFQFNDETVTEIKTLGDKMLLKKKQEVLNENLEDNEEKPNTSTVRKNRANARKRRRIEDSEDEFEEKQKASSASHSNPVDKPTWISSKDAYMLIYARKVDIAPHSTAATSLSLLCPKPSRQAMEVILEQNSAHDSACKEHQEKANFLQGRFRELRAAMKGIYLHWAPTSYNDSAVVSRHALEAWMSEHCMSAFLPDTALDDSCPTEISISDIVCEHGALDPTKSRDMKLLTLRSFNHIVAKTSCTFKPLLKASDVCGDCVSAIFKEKLYEIEHPKHTKLFNEISVIDEGEVGYWISKKWCKDWKLVKPRMHVTSGNDPGPDSPEFYNHVYCEHGGLLPNIANRRKVSAKAVQLLQSLYPLWQPLSGDAETCAICDAEVHMSKEDKKEVRRRIEEEKARLKFIYEPSLDSWTSQSEVLSYAVIPSRFVKEWKRWLSNPTQNPRPHAVDNSLFLCDHDLLSFDPTCAGDIDSSMAVIRFDQWETLQTMYHSGPFIGLIKRPRGDGGGYDADTPVCFDCRLKRKSEWETADILIQLCGREGQASTQPKATLNYSRANGARQSQRLRQIKDHGERRRITVTKSTTVKDIKVMANEEFSIPTICQRLFYKGQELENNSATVAALQFLANDVLDLREAEEVLNIDSDSDEGPITKRRREEGPAFGGTLLGNSDSAWPSSPEDTPGPPYSELQEKACLACTFSNPVKALSCEMCDTIFV